MSRLASLIARFALPALFLAFGAGAAGAATITISPVPVGGKVTSSPGGLNCGSGGATCTSANITAGVSVTLTATPDAGYSFVAWSITGLGSTATNPLSFTMPPSAVTGSAGFVGTAPTITSASSATFTAGQAGLFLVTATGTPAPTFAVTAGSLPAGVALATNGTLSGTPATGTGGTHAVTIRASNGVAPNAFQSFTLTVNEAVAITSVGAATFWEQAPGTFKVTATGFPAPSWFEVSSGALPTGVTLVNNGALAGTLSGTPAAGTAGDYPVVILAANGVTDPDSKPFTLTVAPAQYISRLAGRNGPDPTPDGFPGRAISIDQPFGIARDAAGNLYTAETGQHRIRRIDAATGIVTTVAGTGQAGFAGDGGPAVHAMLYWPRDLALDAAGNLFVFDFNNHRVRRIDAATGVITTVAGNGDEGDGADGALATASPIAPGDAQIAIDAAGDLYYSELPFNRVRKVTAGILSTVAGTGAYGTAGDGGAATAAELGEPFDLHFTAAGDLLITQLNLCRVRKVSGGIITTVIGNGTCGDATPGVAATGSPIQRYPYGVTTDAAGNLYMVNWGIHRVDAVTGFLSTVVGTGANDAWNNGLAVDAGGASAYQLVSRPDGRLAIAFGSEGHVSEVGGPSPIAFTSAATAAFPEQAAGRFFVSAAGFPRPTFAISAGSLPAGVTLTADGVLSGAPAAGTRGSHAVTITAQNGFTTPAQQSFTLVVGAPIVIDSVAGNGAAGYTGDGVVATTTAVNGAKGVARDAAGNLFIADTNNHRIRRVDAATGVITTIAGTGAGGYGGDGGPATSALLQGPTFLAFDAGGNLHVADTGNHRVRRIDAATGAITTVAGNGTTGYGGENVVATTSGLGAPTGIAFDAGGALHIAESAAHRVRRVSGGLIATVAGTGIAGFSGDSGVATSAQLASPNGLAFTAGGELLVADTANHRVRRVSGGRISTLAGDGTAGSAGDGAIAIRATLDQPVAVAVDASGRIFVSTQGRVRRIERPMGVIATVAGNGTAGGAGDGGIPTAASVQPWQVAPAAGGDLFIADAGGHRVRRAGPPSAALAITGPLATTFVKDAPGSFAIAASGFPRAAFSAVGALPAGVTLSTAGVLSGTPTQAGVFAFTVIAANGVSAPDAKTFTLTVSPGSFLVTVSKGGNGSGGVTSSPAGIDCGSTCAASFADGVQVTLVASPAAGSAFAGWGGACAGTGACVFTISGAPVAASASFALDPAGDQDGDGIPNGVEAIEGTNPLARDNDVFANARLFAMQMYRDFLNREGDAAGILGWTGLVNAGTYTRNQVIDAFLSSEEFGGFVAPVVRLYFATYLRVPDYEGLTFNAGLVRNGTVTLTQLADFFTASPEFISRYGALDNAQFVTLLYANVLGRAPDPAGLSGWVALLNGGYTRGQVLLGFSDSVEYQAQMAHEVFVTMMYAGMLRRTPEPAGFNGWVGFLDAGTYTREQVINGFFLSTEYRARFLP